MTPARAHRKKKRIKWLVMSLLAVAALAAGTLGAYFYFHNLQEEELRNSLIANCEKNGNPLREGLTEEKEDEKYLAEHPEKKILDALHIGEAQAIRLAQPRIKVLEKDIKRYEPVNCKEAYEK